MNIEEFIIKCDEETQDFKKAGKHRLLDWEKGWSGDGVYYSDDKEYDNIPYYFKKNTHIRVDNKIFIDINGFAELDLLRSYQIYVFKKYSKHFSVNNIIEYGCGTGSNIQHLKHYFPKINFYGSDWALSACQKLVDNKILLDKRVFRVDYFEPKTFQSPTKSFIAFTNASLEQTSDKYKLFMDYLIKNEFCSGGIHIEPIKELIDITQPLNKQSFEYSKKRNYLNGFVEFLNSKSLKIIQATDYGIGSKYINGYQLVVWKKNI